MEISNINAANPFNFVLPEKDGSGSAAPAASAAVGDVVSLSTADLLTDAEAEGVLHETQGMILGDSAGALAAHSLNHSRVFALLGL